MDTHYPPASFPSQPSPQPPVVKRKPLSFWLALFFGACSVLGGIVILVMFLGMGALGVASHGGAKDAFQEQVVEGSGKAKVAWIPVHGVIMHQEAGGLFAPPDPIDKIIKTVNQAADDDDVKVLVLDVDSPGGGVTESDQIHHAILQAKGKGKKVVALMGDTAASGGYYVSAPADRILAHPTTITGSIGVIFHLVNARELMQKIGLKEEVIKSGKMKDIGSMSRDMTPEETAVLQGTIDEMYGKFLAVVLDGRRHVVLPGEEKLAFTEEHLRRIADGRIYTADQAVANGLVDALGYRDDALAEARKLAGAEDVTVIEYIHRGGLAELLNARLGAPSPLVSMDRKAWAEVLSPRFLYLWSAN